MTEGIRVTATWEDNFFRGKRKVLLVRKKMKGDIQETGTVFFPQSGTRISIGRRMARTEIRKLKREDF